MQTMIIFHVKVFIYRYYAMMDNTLAKKCRKPPKNHQKTSHPAAIFSVLPEKMPETGYYLKLDLLISGLLVLSTMF